MGRIANYFFVCAFSVCAMIEAVKGDPFRAITLAGVSMIFLEVTEIRYRSKVGAV